MTERDRLTEILAKLATETAAIEDGWRRVEGDFAGDPVMAVVTQIDETLFPVALSFRNASGDILNLSVGNRRLRSILGPLPTPLANFNAICDVKLGDPNADIQDQIPNLLRAHVSDSPVLWVRSADTPEAGTAGGGGGLSAKKLTEICAMEPAPMHRSDPATAFDTFAEMLKSRSEGWVKLSDDKVIERSGFEAPDVGGFETFLRLTSTARETAQESGDAEPVLVVFGAQDTWHLAIARYGATSYIAKLPGVVATDLTDLWRSAGF